MPYKAKRIQIPKPHFSPFSFHSFIFPSINFGEQFSAKKSNPNPKSIPNLPKMIDIKKCEPPSMPPTPMTNQQSPIFATSSIAKFKEEMANNGGGGGNESEFKFDNKIT
jgi:hypothetical protein